MAAVLTCTAVPLAVGRGLLGLLAVPPALTHDPFAFAVGVGVAVTFKPALASILPLLLRPRIQPAPSQAQQAHATPNGRLGRRCAG